MSSTTASTSILRVESYGDLDDVARLSNEWRSLWEASDCFQPFCTPEWIDCYLRAFTPKATLMILAVRERDRLIGLVPLVRDFGLYQGFPVRRIRSLANAHSAEFDILSVDSGDRVLSAIWDYLRRLPSWDCVQLRLLPQGKVAEPFLRIASGDRYAAVASSIDSLFVPLTGAPQGPLPWLDTISAQMRRSLRREVRHAESHFNCKLELQRIENADPAQLQRFFEIEASGWKGRNRTAIASAPETIQFYSDIAGSFSAERAFCLHFLMAGNLTLAASFGLILKNRFFGLKSAYREEYGSFSPGQLLLSEILRDLYQRGISELNFGLDADYMRHWTSHSRVLTTCVVFNGTPYGRLLHRYKAKLRPDFRHAVERIRSLLRKAA